jgi:hypothetical protein
MSRNGTRISTRLWTGITAALRWVAGVSPTVLLIVIGIVAVAFTVRSCDANKDAATDLRVVSKSIEAADRAVTGQQAAKASISKNEQRGYARTEAALEAHRDWASQPVPDDVLDSLRN